jgi:hypothetical protein
MNLSEFQDLPDEARVWVHCFEQELSEQQQEIIQKGMEEFLPQWDSHGAPVKAFFKILSGHFVVTAAYSQEGISGCSMDSLQRNFKTFKTAYGLDGLKGGLLFYRDKEGTIQVVDQLKFQDLIESGEITSETQVFQTLLSTLGQLRSGEFETPFEKSWLSRTFSLPAPRG